MCLIFGGQPIGVVSHLVCFVQNSCWRICWSVMLWSCNTCVVGLVPRGYHLWGKSALEGSGYKQAYCLKVWVALWNLYWFQFQIGVARNCQGIQIIVFQHLVWLQVLTWSLYNRIWIRIGFGRLCLLVGSIVLIHWEHVFEGACVNSHCPDFAALGTISFHWLRPFWMFSEAIYLMNRIIVFIVQKVPHWDRVKRLNVFRLFMCR